MNAISGMDPSSGGESMSSARLDIFQEHIGPSAESAMNHFRSTIGSEEEAARVLAMQRATDTLAENEEHARNETYLLGFTALLPREDSDLESGYQSYRYGAIVCEGANDAERTYVARAVQSASLGTRYLLGVNRVAETTSVLYCNPMPRHSRAFDPQYSVGRIDVIDTKAFQEARDFVLANRFKKYKSEQLERMRGASRAGVAKDVLIVSLTTPGTMELAHDGRYYDCARAMGYKGNYGSMFSERKARRYVINQVGKQAAQALAIPCERDSAGQWNMSAPRLTDRLLEEFDVHAHLDETAVWFGVVDGLRGLIRQRDIAIAQTLHENNPNAM